MFNGKTHLFKLHHLYLILLDINLHLEPMKYKL
jgi:hypothetical protein